MKLIQTAMWVVYTPMFAMWVWAEVIRLVAPRYHAKMLRMAKEGRWNR